VNRGPTRRNPQLMVPDILSARATGRRRSATAAVQRPHNARQNGITAAIHPTPTEELGLRCGISVHLHLQTSSRLGWVYRPAVIAILVVRVWAAVRPLSQIVVGLWRELRISGTIIAVRRVGRVHHIALIAVFVAGPSSRHGIAGGRESSAGDACYIGARGRLAQSRQRMFRSAQANDRVPMSRRACTSRAGSSLTCRRHGDDGAWSRSSYAGGPAGVGGDLRLHSSDRVVIFAYMRWDLVSDAPSVALCGRHHGCLLGVFAWLLNVHWPTAVLGELVPGIAHGGPADVSRAHIWLCKQTSCAELAHFQAKWVPGARPSLKLRRVLHGSAVAQRA